MSASGAPVTTYCILAVAPGRSGNSWASSFPLSSHSCDRYYAMPGPPRHELFRRRRMLASDAVAHAGEQVVLRRRALDQRAGEDEVLERIDVAGDLGRQSEPERRGGV